MPPLGGALVAGGLAGVGAIAKGIRARKQRKQAEELEKNNVRPEMTRTSASMQRQQNAAQAVGSTMLPGEARFKNEIGAQTARSTNAIMQTGGSTGEIIAGLGAVDSGARKSGNDLAQLGADYNQRNKELQNNILADVSEEQKDIFDYNKNQPYQTNALKAQSLRDASARNSDNAWSSVEDAASNIGVASGYRKSNKIK